MWKRIVLSTLIVAMVGVLVLGAVNRTVAKTGDYQAQGSGYRRGHSQLDLQTTVPLNDTVIGLDNHANADSEAKHRHQGANDQRAPLGIGRGRPAWAGLSHSEP